ncbi:unnamed protein product [Ectocarpus sp. CCAP 1310/34]|nr:unnamed protein product [Ectocarpus sp. CCAP 1310/34]
MIDDVKELLTVGSKVREAIEATDVAKKRRRARLKDYDSTLHVLLQSGSPDKFKSELQRLHDIYHEIEALHVKHTADPEDPTWVRFAKKVNRGTQHKSIEEDLDAIDGQALQLITAIAAKSSIGNSKAIRQILQDLKLEGRRVSGGSTLLVAGGVFGAVFVEIAALALAHRDGEAPVDVFEAVELVLRDFGPDGLRVSDGTQLFVVGLIGALVVAFGAVTTAQRNAVFSMIRAADGPINPETALAPSTVVGMGGGGKTVLASAIVRDPSVREHFLGGISWVSVGRNGKRSLPPLLQTLAREITTAPTDAPHGVPHALDGLEQVVTRCGRPPLGLGMAVSMPIVKGKGLTAGAWTKLFKELENVAKKMRARGEQSTSLKLVIETSFDALLARKREEMSVMAAGAVAPIEMLLNLWGIQVMFLDGQASSLSLLGRCTCLFVRRSAFCDPENCCDSGW